MLRLLEMAGAVYGRKPPRVCVPYTAGLAAAYLSELVANYITGREPAATVTGVKLTRRMMQLDCSRAVRELGFQPRTVESAVAEAINWYQDQGWIPAVADASRGRLLHRA